MRFQPVIAAAAALGLALAVSALAAPSRPAWVEADTLVVRSGPGTDRDAIGKLDKGEKVYVTVFRDGWCHATLPSGAKGWLSERYLQFSHDKGRALAAGQKSGSKASAAPRPAWVNCTTCNVRGGASTSSKQLGTLNKGEKVYIVARQGEWYKVSTPSGGRGWIHQDLLETDVALGRKLAEGETTAEAAAKA